MALHVHDVVVGDGGVAERLAGAGFVLVDRATLRECVDTEHLLTNLFM